jgi:hypothetical protein
VLSMLDNLTTRSDLIPRFNSRLAADNSSPRF